jgi:hypothetical protein
MQIFEMLLSVSSSLVWRLGPRFRKLKINTALAPRNQTYGSGPGKEKNYVSSFQCVPGRNINIRLLNAPKLCSYFRNSLESIKKTTVPVTDKFFYIVSKPMAIKILIKHNKTEVYESLFSVNYRVLVWSATKNK